MTPTDHYTLQAFEALSVSEVAILLGQDPAWSLPRGCSNRAGRMRAALDLYQRESLPLRRHPVPAPAIPPDPVPDVAPLQARPPTRSLFTVNDPRPAVQRVPWTPADRVAQQATLEAYARSVARRCYVSRMRYADGARRFTDWAGPVPAYTVSHVRAFLHWRSDAGEGLARLSDRLSAIRHFVRHLRSTGAQAADPAAGLVVAGSRADRGRRWLAKRPERINPNGGPSCVAA